MATLPPPHWTEQVARLSIALRNAVEVGLSVESVTAGSILSAIRSIIDREMAPNAPGKES